MRDCWYITALMMGTEMVPEKSVIFNQLTRLVAREDFIDNMKLFSGLFCV
jgi:hypothetical protein